MGLISALAKIEGAALAKHFRPITVFSLVYRVYSSLRSRQALAFIAEDAPVTMAGGMPGRSSVSVWWHIQLSIEKAYAEGRPLSGACFDLSKAFNTLPRLPVFAIAIKSGIHKDLVRSWSGAVSAVQRRFRARGSVGPPLLACCGFAEGCGLSVLAMALVDVALHQPAGLASPRATLHSFVDDWQTLAVDVPSLALADSVVQAFARQWDMELDPTKAVAWATTPQHRAELRSSGAKVVLDARNLGGHCSYSRRCTNFTVTQRIQGMADLWPKLAFSRAPYHQKLSALMTVAWPRGLHGCEAVNLGENWFKGLRTRALEGLGCRKPGANALLHLSLISPTSCDPGFKALEATVMACRYWSKREAVQPLLDEIVSENWGVKTGPAAVLVRRMTQVGIFWSPGDGSFHDQLGNLDLWDAPIQEVQFRLQLAWHDWVTDRVKHRPGFQGLERCDPMAARKMCATLPPDARALLHAALDGTFWTEDHLHHICEADSPQCKWCSQRDSCYHRIWQCPHFAATRAEVFARHPGSHGLVQPECLPECQACHAWPCEPPELRSLWRRLSEIPDTCHVHQYFSAANEVHLFTDGSCLLPRVPQLRLAAWAVCVGVDPQQEPIVIAGGQLAGFLQTAFRAELAAVLAAILVAARKSTPCWVYSDCQGVVDRVQGFLNGFPRPSTRGRNSDLWVRIFDAVHEAGQWLRGIVKVRAHQDITMARSPEEAWMWANNHHADRAADAMNQARSPQFWNLWDRVRKGWVLESLRAKLVFDLHRTIALRAVSDDTPQRSPVIQMDTTRLPVLSCAVVSNEELIDVSRTFGFQFCQVLANWIRLRCHGSHAGTPKWMSLLQLLISGHRVETTCLPCSRKAEGSSRYPSRSVFDRSGFSQKVAMVAPDPSRHSLRTQG